MNKDNARDYLPLVQALAEGKVIQVVDVFDGEWIDIHNMDFGAPAKNYRIKPEPREIWVNEWANGKRIFYSHGDATLHAMQYPLVRSTTRYREVIE